MLANLLITVIAGTAVILLAVAAASFRKPAKLNRAAFTWRYNDEDTWRN